MGTSRISRYLLAKALGLGLDGLPFFEQDAGCINIIDWVGMPGAPLCPIIRLVNGTMDNPMKTGAAIRLWRASTRPIAPRAAQHVLAAEPQRPITTVVQALSSFGSSRASAMRTLRRRSSPRTTGQ